MSMIDDTPEPESTIWDDIIVAAAILIICCLTSIAFWVIKVKAGI